MHTLAHTWMHVHTHTHTYMHTYIHTYIRRDRTHLARCIRESTARAGLNLSTGINAHLTTGGDSAATPSEEQVQFASSTKQETPLCLEVSKKEQVQFANKANPSISVEMHAYEGHAEGRTDGHGDRRTDGHGDRRTDGHGDDGTATSMCFWTYVMRNVHKFANTRYHTHEKAPTQGLEAAPTPAPNTDSSNRAQTCNSKLRVSCEPEKLQFWSGYFLRWCAGEQVQDETQDIGRAREQVQDEIQDIGRVISGSNNKSDTVYFISGAHNDSDKQHIISETDRRNIRHHSCALDQVEIPEDTRHFISGTDKESDTVHNISETDKESDTVHNISGTDKESDTVHNISGTDKESDTVHNISKARNASDHIWLDENKNSDSDPSRNLAHHYHGNINTCTLSESRIDHNQSADARYDKNKTMPHSESHVDHNQSTLAHGNNDHTHTWAPSSDDDIKRAPHHANKTLSTNSESVFAKAKSKCMHGLQKTREFPLKFDQKIRKKVLASLSRPPKKPEDCVFGVNVGQ
jgi:hypothetical protein